MKRILKSRYRAFLIITIAFIISCNSKEKHVADSQEIKYTCPMHSQIIKDGPGSCPICGMDLVPLKTDLAHSSADDSLRELVRPTDEHVFSTIKTVLPETGSRILKSSLKGVINYNTNNWNSISSRVAGRIERLYVKYNFEAVSKGQKIMEIYSPDLVNAQQELLFLKNNSEPALLESAKRKLRYLGSTEAQITRVLRTGKVDYTVPVYSPHTGYVAESQLNSIPSAQAAQTGGSNTGSGTSASMGSMGGDNANASVPSTPAINQRQPLQLREGQYISAGQNLFNLINVNQVWAEFYARPEQLRDLKTGVMVEIQAMDIPGQRSRVPVRLIQPFYNEGVNYSLVRAVVPNTDQVWKIGQLITVSKENDVNGVWLPRTAVLQLGIRYVTFIKRNSAFVPVFIDVNKIADEWVDIGNSLNENQEVALNAWFLIDSESFIKAERL